MDSKWDILSRKEAKEFGKFLEHQKLYPETKDDLWFSYNLYRDQNKDATKCCKTFHLLHALKASGFISKWEGIYITWKSCENNHVYSKVGKIADGDNLQLQDKFLTSNSKMSYGFYKRSSGATRDMGIQFSEYGASDANCDNALNERVVWGGKKNPAETSSSNLILLPCSDYENEGIEISNISKKISNSTPARYVPLKKLQSLKESETSKNFRSEESLKAGSKCKSSISKHENHEAAGKAQTSDDGSSDKNSQKQREKSVVSREQAGTGIGKTEHLIVNGKMKGTGECRNMVERRGCELEKHTGVTINDKKEGNALMQWNPIGSHIYSCNTMPSCKPLPRVDNISVLPTCKTKKIEESNWGKRAETTSEQDPQIGRKKAIYKKSAVYQEKVDRHCANNGIDCLVWKKREQIPAHTSKTVEHGAVQLEDCEFKGSSVSNNTIVYAKELLCQDIDRFENAKEIGSNVNGGHGSLGRQTDDGGATGLELAENQDRIPEELEGEGICVSYPFPFDNGKPQGINRGGVESEAISIVNNRKTSVNLLAINLVHSRPSNSFSLSLSTAGPRKSVQCYHKCCLSSVNSLEYETKSMPKFQIGANSLSLVGGTWLIEPGHHLVIFLSCIAKDIGVHRSSILFNFQDQEIIRHAIVFAEDEVSKQLAPIEPYCRFRRRKLRTLKRFVRGVPPPLPVFGKKLGGYLIPNNLRKNVGKEVPRILEEDLSMDTYSEYFSTLLYLEELQLQEDRSAYDMHNVTMSNRFAYLVLKVPGLLEKRPSLIYRDHVYVTASGKEDKTYQGYIYKVEADEIFLKFHKSFHEKFVPSLLYDVQFSFSRINLRRCHQAIEEAKGLPGSILFPHKPLAKMVFENTAKITPFNRSLNIEQLSAVHQILNFRGSPPYLLYGPPGTGKTLTIVETIFQILARNSNSHILACAPSNSASDLLLVRLLGLMQQKELFRLNAYTRPHEDVPSEILPCCWYEDSTFCCPPVKMLLKYKVIVSTYLSAALLNAKEVPRGHFTHIFLDESGQGTEPETMVPIANFATAETTIVLAGDPQQLGPIIRSPIAEKFGLGKSYLERLSELGFYSLDRENKEFATKLVRNYRCHPTILEIPSRLFYGGELIACVAEEIQASLCEWEELPNKKFPVLFVGIEGYDEREGTSPSWFNTIEISKVMEIIKKLRDNKRSWIGGEDIGVITPYQRQVVKLKKALAANALYDIKVGTVEQFQGEEKHVIIISTVRSSYKYEEFNEKYNLGFLRNPKRFNVAITRAKSLLVVVGNPHILSKDKYWNELLQHCICHKSYVGCSPP